jgi:hypothetical protein
VEPADLGAQLGEGFDEALAIRMPDAMVLP